MVLTYDTINIKDSKVEIAQNGFAIFKDVKIANSGNIQRYKNYELGDLPEELQHKREIKIFRPADEVEKSVASFAHVALTDTHPWDNVNTKNFKELGVGFSTAVSFKDNHVIASSIVVTDSDMIVELQSNKESKELSCGYWADFVYEAGTTDDGDSYDGYMKNLTGNHIAIVEKGRCGGTCRLWE